MSLFKPIRHINQSLDRLLCAVQFNTILPIGPPAAFDATGMIQYFPIVGLILGAMLSAFDQLAIRIWSLPIAGALDVVFLLAVTGAFHIDGLGDAADGLFGHRPPEKALEIMKDSRIGAMGLVAILCGLTVKWCGLSAIENHRSLVLVLVPALARGGTLFAIRYLPYGRPTGTGVSLFDRPLTRSDFWAVCMVAGLTLFLGWQGLFLLVGFVFFTSLILGYYSRRLGCVTGDMLGAMTEVLEAMLFLLVSMWRLS